MAWVNTNSMILPVLIPRAATPAITGWNSTWLIAGAAMVSWLLFGSKVMPAVRKALGGGGRKKAAGGKKKKTTTTTYA